VFTDFYLNSKPNYVRALLLSIIAMWAAFDLAAETPTVLSGTITHVRDGDTFEVGGIPVRLAALDCPENKTAAGKSVTAYAKQFEGLHTECQLTGAMSYERVVGYCTIDGVDYGAIMMRVTSCKLWKKFDVFKRYEVKQ